MKKQCPQCGDVYPEIARICARDKTPLVPFDLAFAPPVRQAAVPLTNRPGRSYRSGGSDMMIGALVCLAGLAITVVSYSVASSGQGGGHYLVSWGAIVFGGWRFLRGLFRSSTERDRMPYDDPPPAVRKATLPEPTANPQKPQDLY